MDRSDLRTTARELLERQGTENPQQRDRDTASPALNVDYPGRLHRLGGMEGENFAAHYYNKDRVNQKWFAHERSKDNGHQVPAQGPEGRGRHVEQRPLAAPERELGGGARNRQKEREPQPARTPSQGMPDKGEVRIELRHGFNTDAPRADPRNHVRMPYEQERPQDRTAPRAGLKQEINVKAPPREQDRASLDERLARADHPRAQEMRASSRELLQRIDEPQHPMPQRPERGPGLNRPHGLER